MWLTEGVGDRRGQHAVDVARRAMAVVAQLVESGVDRTTADQRQDAPSLVGTHAGAAVNCANFEAHFASSTFFVE